MDTITITLTGEQELALRHLLTRIAMGIPANPDTVAAADNLLSAINEQQFGK